MEVLGAVLVGGASRRMGRDKALLPTPDGPLAESLARRLEAVPGIAEVVMVSRESPDERFPDRRVVADHRPGGGPLAGLEAALLAAQGRPVFALACDLPNVPVDLVEWVVGSGFAADAVPAARVPFLDGRLQPLCALYSAACLPVVTGLLEESNPKDQEGGTARASMHALLERLALARLVVHSGLPFHHPALFRNLNTPADRLASEAS